MRVCIIFFLLYNYKKKDVHGNSWSNGIIDVGRIFIFRRWMRSI